MVTTRDPELDARVRAWRSHGTRDGVFGFNYRMTDIQAAIGRVQLGRLPELVAERRRIAGELRARLRTARCAAEPAWARSNWQSVCARFASAGHAAAAMSRLAADGIAARPGLTNAHEDAEQRDGVRAPLAESERARRECILLPLPSHMTGDELDRVIAAVDGSASR